MEVEHIGEDTVPPAVAVCSGSSQDSEYVSEDEQIQHLEQTGAMQQVVGSQSILSQEIHNLGGAGEVGGLSQDIPGFSQESAGTTATTEFDSQVLAHKYGLLSQDPVSRSRSDASDSDHEESVDSQYEDSPADSTRNVTLLGLSDSQESKIGTLLDAVQIFQSREEEAAMKLKMYKDATDSSHSSAAGPDSVRERSLRSGSSHQGWAMASPEPPASKNKGGRPRRNAAKRSKKPALPLAKKTKKSAKIKKIKSTAAASPSNGRKAVAAATVDARTGKASTSRAARTAKASSPGKTPPSPSPKPPSPAPAEAPTSSQETSASAPVPGAAPRKRKSWKHPQEVMEQKLAQRAAALAERSINDPELAKRLLLSMALTRENPRSAPETLPGPAAVLPEGFFWAHYPPLEKVLKDNMAEYYELSVTKCQSAQQQSFNNRLVELVRVECDRQQWLFAPCFTDKILRDRIRCYYKTHIQNAKKRLRTMVKNPTKRANARHLCAHLDMIATNMISNNEQKKPEAPSHQLEGPNVITHQDWGSSMAGSVQPKSPDQRQRAATTQTKEDGTQQQPQQQTEKSDAPVPPLSSKGVPPPAQPSGTATQAPASAVPAPAMSISRGPPPGAPAPLGAPMPAPITTRHPVPPPQPYHHYYAPPHPTYHPPYPGTGYSSGYGHNPYPSHAYGQPHYYHHPHHQVVAPYGHVGPHPTPSPYPTPVPAPAALGTVPGVSDSAPAGTVAQHSAPSHYLVPGPAPSGQPVFAPAPAPGQGQAMAPPNGQIFPTEASPPTQTPVVQPAVVQPQASLTQAPIVNAASAPSAPPVMQETSEALALATPKHEATVSQAASDAPAPAVTAAPVPTSAPAPSVLVSVPASTSS